MRRRVLVIDDDQSMCELLASGLKHHDLEIAWETSAAEALEAVGSGEFDVVVTDLRMKDMDGIQLCEWIVANRPNVPVIVMTAFGSMESAVAAIRAGAYDFQAKPFEMEALAIALDRALRHRELREEVTLLRRRLEIVHPFDEILGESPPIRELCALLEQVAQSDASVLIFGETGTGKELAARAIHRRSPHRAGPFVALNCAAMPEALLESELFGHERGAFTDAKSARKGLFQRALGGTIFLDEVGDMALSLQVKLLRALQERTVRPVGGDREVPIDVHVISATRHDLEAAVEKGLFREDLLYRINVIQVDIPPLCARGNDVLLLAQHFLKGFAARSSKRVEGLSSSAAERLLGYDWPGNVRELANCIQRAVALTHHDRLIVEDLPPKIRKYRAVPKGGLGDASTELIPIHQVERRHILRVLQAVEGNKARAARILGLDRGTLYRKLDRFQKGSGRHRQGKEHS